MYAVIDSAEGDYYLCVPPDPGIEAAALGASASAAPGTTESTAPGTGESALSRTAPTEALHTFTLDSGASRSFFRDSTTLTPLSRPVAVSLADPSGGLVLAHSSTVLPCLAAPSGLLSGLHLPSFSTNLVSGAGLQDAWVDQFTLGGQRVTHRTCSRTGRHLATFTRWPGSSLYTLTTASPLVTASGQVAASGQMFAAASRSSPVSAPCSCRPLSDETLLWHHRLGHPSLPRLQGMASRTLRRIGMVMDVPRTSMIHAAAPHLLWPFAVRCTEHQINLQPRVSLPETTPPLRWTGKVGDASVFRVWGSRAFVRDTSADKLSSRAVPCVFLGFPPDAPGWQFYHPTSRRVQSSQNVTFNVSVSYYRVPPVDPLPPQGPAPSGSGGAVLGVAESEGAELGGAEPMCVEPGSAEPGGAESGGAELGGAEPEHAESGGPPSVSSQREPLSPQRLCEWYAWRCSHAAGATGPATRGASGAGAAGGAAGAGGTGTIGGPTGVGATGASCAAGVGGVAEGAGAVATRGAAGAGAAGGTGAGGDAGVCSLELRVLVLSLVLLEALRGRGRTTFRFFSRFLVSRLLLVLLLPLRVKRPPGSPPVFKARYVARGFSQQQGVDFFQTFSPTPKTTTLRVLLHVAAQRDYKLHSLDFSTAFLQGSLHEEIWLRRPPGFTGLFPTGTQWSLRRPVYGLCQAPREWHDTLRTTLAALGFAPSTADPSLFLRTDTTLPPFYILVYVDDLVFATADTEALAHMKSELQKRHTCTDLGELTSYLGLRITWDRAQRTITLTQSHMVQQVLQRFGFTYSSPQSTPLPTGHSLSAPPSDESVEPSGLYPELVGCLMYLMTCTRPDLAYPLSILARYVAPGRHRKEHMDAAKRVLRYLCSTSGMGLVLGGRARVVLTGHADASWVDDLAMQRLSQGYTFSRFSSDSVSWQSTHSSSVLSSSCEAEIYAGAMAAQELRWLTYLLTDLGELPHSPPVLYLALPFLTGLVTSCSPPLCLWGSAPVFPLEILEERQFELGFLVAAIPHLCSMLLALEGDPIALDIMIPCTHAEAVSGPWASYWIAAEEAEMASYRSTSTYVDAVPPPGANVISFMWLYKVKRPPGAPPVFKVRYVARGFSQREGVDFIHTFAPTPKMTTLWVLLHTTAQGSYELHSLALSTSFLQGSLHEQIWLRCLPGFTGSFPPGTQWQLHRPDYGLRQAPSEWHDTLRTTLAALEFFPSSANPLLFIRHGSTPFFVLVYIDDLITRDRAARSITLTRSHMVEQILTRFCFPVSKVQPTPLAMDHGLTAPPSDDPFESSGPYPELVGCLMYLMTCTHPDLAYPLSVLARLVAPGRHRPSHWYAAKRVAKYVASTSSMGLVLGGKQPVTLTGFSDSSSADDAKSMRSTQGYCFSLGTGAVSWRSTRASSVSSSSCEAEVYAAAMAAQELRWLFFLLTDLGEWPRSPPVLFVNNRSAILLCEEPRLVGKAKHI
ncbi:unnamed protein product [Closterium sp. NIES-53]